MHVLVTGAGLAGTHISTHLARGGFEVTTAARRCRAAFEERGLDGGAMAMVDADIGQVDRLPARIDAIVHTASSLPWPHKTADDMVRDNVTAMHRLVAFARERQVGAFIFFSTVSVYGDIQVPVVDERTPITNPALYGTTKLIGEQMLAECASDFPSLVLRLPGLIGPLSRPNWLTKTRRKIAAGESVVISNPDAPFNNAAHVHDMAAFVEQCLSRGLDGFDVLNLAADGAIPIADVIDRLMRGLGRTVSVEQVASTSQPFLISIDRAKADYGYRPMEIGHMIDVFAGEEI
jgi:nucleoside-diphosphate-sugar epimerase